MNAKSTIAEDVATTSTLLGKVAQNFPTPAALTEHGSAKVISIFNQKGGVGKTTSTINLGAALAELGRRVLLVDFDPQGGLSLGLGVNAHSLPLEQTVYYALMTPTANVDDIVIITKWCKCALEILLATNFSAQGGFSSSQISVCRQEIQSGN